MSPDNSPTKIENLSFLNPEDIKLQNTHFLEQDGMEYHVGQGLLDHRLRHDIWVVRNGDIKKLLQRFPYDEPLHDQCALWMQAFVGKHFFPDANHRTGVVILREIMAENDLPPGDWDPERTRQVRDESHTVRGELPTITLADIYQKDPLYDVWRRYFDDVLEYAKK
ncbi:hypothetical protein [Haladaptatus caseinilyticus]|uniref:hypothetical protein n=1 Tax=Haladaptatus caseinilyticus TaxID=2993314 RepID=UPI00224A6F3E|nr:hypothetical protein [Haladaptatus caseinilyticus]